MASFGVRRRCCRKLADESLARTCGGDHEQIGLSVEGTSSDSFFLDVCQLLDVPIPSLHKFGRWPKGCEICNLKHDLHIADPLSRVTS